VSPPSRVIIAAGQVARRVRGEKNAIRPATSPGWPSRPSGILAISEGSDPRPRGLTDSGVSMMPGQIAFRAGQPSAP